MHWIADYSLFLAKVLTLVVAILITVAGILVLVSKAKPKSKGHLELKKLNEQFAEQRRALQNLLLPKAQLKKLAKQARQAEKQRETSQLKRLFVLQFQGDIKASAVAALREEITAILQIATPHDEVVLRLESPGGMVPHYGLAASQLQRIRQKQIPLTIIVDKIAASGGYLMACVADRILAAPFAIIGSIGVIAQLPNFNRLLKKNQIDFEQITAGEYKRTLSLFGENTEVGREKFKEELEEVHQQFKAFIEQNRPQVDIAQVANGEHWLGSRALALNLIDGLATSDDYLLTASQDAELLEVTYTVKKALSEKLVAAIKMAGIKLLSEFR